MRKIRLSLEYDSSKDPVVPPTVIQHPIQQQSIPTTTEQPIQPSYSAPHYSHHQPTHIQQTTHYQHPAPVTTSLAPTVLEVPLEQQLQRGAVITSIVVCGLAGLQLYPPAWNYLESQKAVQEIQRVFNRLPGASQPGSSKKTKLSLNKLDIATPKRGERIGNFIVTSGWGRRPSPVPGASSYHRGIDVGVTIGTAKGKPLYAIGLPGEVLKVSYLRDATGGGGNFVSFTSPGLNKTFRYLHLDSGKSGLFKPGDLIGYIGDSGIGSGAHLHFQQRNSSFQIEPPYRIYVEASLDQSLARNLLSRGEN
jgi:murein DD-endopeptidase MepM/ murein hydrolase activator NlpD